ncbi:MAG TPA: MBL fold metallo-hydrolase [Casimicrobiaceae bacterium]|nr:MBL fold metallo-hydrolase [Casimicrobiaceae bacterium]
MTDSKREAIRPAATLVLLRDSAAGPEVFMLRRAQGAVFLGGAYVFPGGAVDRDDSSAELLSRVTGIDEAEANARLGLATGALAYWVAAMRECFEEAGILVARDASGAPLPSTRLAELARNRDALCRGEIAFKDAIVAANCLLPADELVYFDHWVTPPLRPRRFDTRFFMARAPAEQEGSHDNTETVHSLWIRPQEALDQHRRKDIELAFATRTILATLATHDSVDASLAMARARKEIEINRPTIAQGRDGPKLFRLGDAPYCEIHWSDPGESTQTTYDMVPGAPKRLDPLVARIIAPNPGMMTGPGTNTYLVGDAALAVIDPGPAIDSHIDAIVAAGGDRIRWILCTHTHRDHSPAAMALHERTGAQVIGRPAPEGPTQDVHFAPQHIPEDDEVLELGGVRLRALHTPGHASNHVCYLLENTRMLFTGDHVMQGSTVIINPPDGDMRAYLASLERLIALQPAIIAPGHGYLIGSPAREMRRLIEHRLWRERKIVAALEHTANATLEELVPQVYDDVPSSRHAAAARSLLAHLGKLEREGRVLQRDARYRLA